MRRSDSFDSVKSAQSFISANSADKDGSSAGLAPPYAGGGGGRCVIVQPPVFFILIISQIWKPTFCYLSVL